MTLPIVEEASITLLPKAFSSWKLKRTANLLLLYNLLSILIHSLLYHLKCVSVNAPSASKIRRVRFGLFRLIGDHSCVLYAFEGQELIEQGVLLFDSKLELYWDHMFFRVLVEAEVPAFGYTTVVMSEESPECPKVESPITATVRLSAAPFSALVKPCTPETDAPMQIVVSSAPSGGTAPSV